MIHTQCQSSFSVIRSFCQIWQNDLITEKLDCKIKWCRVNSDTLESVWQPVLNVDVQVFQFSIWSRICQINQVFTYPYPEIFPLSALIDCNAMNWPGGTAIYLSHKFHHWLMLYTFGQYIMNVQWSITGDGFLTIFKFGIRVVPKNLVRSITL